MTTENIAATVLGPNPFEGNVVHDVWQALPVDVESIHQNVFENCLAALESVSRGKSDAIAIYGPAGSGKTHLLSRLQHHLVATSRGAPDGATRCMFVAVKLQTNAAQLWQHVRRRLAADLQRQTQGVSQLQRLIAHQLAAARSEPPGYWVRALRVLTSLQEESVTEHLHQLAAELDLSRDLTVVLDHLVLGRHLHDARAWLRGESLPETVLTRLGLGGEDGDDREEAARQVVSALCRLAGNTLPIVFCFDQIEAIQLHRDDRDALFRFGRMAAELADVGGNVLIISCLQSALVDELTQSIRQADRDRIFKRATVLQPLSPAQVEALIKLRLDASPELASLRRAEPSFPFYPLDAQTVRTLTATSPCTPRRVLAHASERFESMRGKAPALVSVENFLEEAFDTRRRARLAAGGPEDSSVTLEHGMPMLWSIRSATAAVAVPAEDASLGIHALLPMAAGTLRVSVRNETNLQSLAARLRKLIASAENGGPSHRGLIILRDAERPIRLTAARCREYINELEQAGARFETVSAEALAALEVLRELVSDARSGDLSFKGEPVSETRVCDWLKRSLDQALVALSERLELALQDAPSTPKDKVAG